MTSIANVGGKNPPEGKPSKAVPNGVDSISSSTLQNLEQRGSGSNEPVPILDLEIRGQKLKNRPNPKVWKYRISEIKDKKGYKREFLRYRLSESSKNVKKFLLEKLVKLRQLSVTEFLLLDHLIQHTYVSTERDGTLKLEVLLIRSLLSTEKDYTSHSLKRPYDSTLFLRVFSICLVKHYELDETEGSEADLIPLLSKDLKFSDRKSFDTPPFRIERVWETTPFPSSKGFLNMSNSAAGRGNYDPTHPNDSIQNGESDSNNFDLKVLEFIEECKRK